MNVLVVGSGGREHALAWKIRQSPLCEELYVAPGNGGTAQLATNLDIGVNEFERLGNAIAKHAIGIVVIGPEDPLVNGLVDYLKADEKHKDLLIVGPGKDGAQLEGSKDFAKQFMIRHGIPTASAMVVTKKNVKEGLKYLDSLKPPYVLKADGLAAGKGVAITHDVQDARDRLKEFLGGKFGKASDTVLIEEFLSGIELSVFVLTDGKSYAVLPEAKDYKRIGEGDEGPNTGGMGAVSPVTFADRIFMEKVNEQIVKPTIEGIQQEGFDYKGFIFIGLMNVNNNPFVIEYNVRMGDPETEVVLPRVKTDLLTALQATASGNLDQVKMEFEPYTASTVVLVSEGYPGAYEKGRPISIGKMTNIIPFHAGTTVSDGVLQTNGGRVMALTALGKNLDEALNKSYMAARNVSWEGMNFRRDIGFDLKKLGQ